MEKVLKINRAACILILVVVFSGAVLAGDVIVKSGDLETAGKGSFLGGVTTLSEEKLEDPDFDGSIGTTWETTDNGPEWSISAGIATKGEGDAETLTETNPFTVKPDTTYRMVIDIATGKIPLTASLGGDSEELFGWSEVEAGGFTGIKTVFFETTNDTAFSITASGGGDSVSLNSVSIKETKAPSICLGNTKVENLDVIGAMGLWGNFDSWGKLVMNGPKALVPGGDAPSVLSITGGVGGRKEGSASTGGIGGGIVLTTGAGGKVENGGGPMAGGNGGSFVLTTGNGGDAESGATKVGGDGGDVELTTGAGGEGEYNGNYGNVILAKDGGKVLIGNVEEASSPILQIDGTAIADEWLDWTPAWTGTEEEALQSILNIVNKDGEIDHSSLPDIARVDLSYYRDVNCRMVTEDIIWDGVVYEDVTYEKCDKELVEKEGRSLGGMITVLVEAVKALSDKVERLEAEN